jgi:hypothetical protein
MDLNQYVFWKDCPGVVSAFAVTRIRGFSDCGRYVLLGCIYHPVPIEALAEPKPEEIPAQSIYRPYTENDWGEDGIDKATRYNLTAWVENYEQKRERDNLTF